MKKKILYIITILFVFSFSIISLSAEEIVVGKISYSATNVRVRSIPGAAGEVVAALNFGDEVNILNYNSPARSNPDDSYNWYNVSFVKKVTNINGIVEEINITGYIRADLISVLSPPIGDGIKPTTEYEIVLAGKGFPSSYWPYLKQLHELYPNWEFEAYNTLENWDNVLTEESYDRKSLIQGNEGYRATDDISYNWLTNTWLVRDGTNWYNANLDTIAYYLDPRNFLDERKIFMFEKLSFHEGIDYGPLVQNLFNNTYLQAGSTDGSIESFASTFVKAGRDYNVSPLHLAAKSLIETGKGTPGNPPTVTSGNPFDYWVLKSDINKPCTSEKQAENQCTTRTLSGYYNFFNIGAYNISATNINSNWKQGLVYARGYLSLSYTTLGRPWDNAYKGVMGGSQFVAGSYISVGQDTPYFQKWDVVNNGGSKFSHQYMQNITAPLAEAIKAYNSYATAGLLNLPFIFKIPVYSAMPVATSLPAQGNPNNMLKSIKINSVDINNFEFGRTEYTYYVNASINSITIDVTPVVASATVTGNGTINLSSETTINNLVVKAANGDERTYKITVIKTDTVPITNQQIFQKLNYNLNSSYISNIGLNVTPEVVINNMKKIYPLIDVRITNAAGETKTAILATGDKMIVKNREVQTEYTFVIKGDVDGNGLVDIVDLLKTRKKILGYSLIGPYLSASDINNDGNVGIDDLLKIRKHILGYTVIK